MTSPNDGEASRALADLRRVASALSQVRDVAELGAALDGDLRPVLRAALAIVVGRDGQRFDAVSGDPGLAGEDAAFAAARETARAGDPMWLHDSEAIAARHPSARSASAALAAMPLRSGRRGVGALVLGFREPQSFDESQRASIEDVAREVAATVERLRLREETQRLRKRVEAAAHSRTEFMAQLGHELRNPLAALRTASELLRIADLEDKMRRIHAVIERQTEHLVLLVDELLEVGPAAEEGARSTTGKRASPMRVMLIEDNEDTAELLQSLLESLGYESAISLDGEHALDIAQRFAPDVVLCDVGLPGVSGYDVARAFRGDGALRNVYMVAVTGYGRPEDVEEARAAGFDAHKTKPIDSVAIQELVLAARAARGGERSARSIRFFRGLHS